MKHNRFAAIAIAAFLEAQGFPALALDNGWWVIVASFPEEPWQRQSADLEATSRKAARCGLEVFNDRSGKFRGFAPGSNVFVIGAFPSKARAVERLRAAQRCFPDAYVKQGRHLGE